MENLQEGSSIGACSRRSITKEDENSLQIGKKGYNKEKSTSGVSKLFMGKSF